MDIPPNDSPVTLTDLKALTAMAAGIDGHDRGPATLEVWLAAAKAGGWTRAQVAAATLALASTFTGFRIMPGHVTAQIAADREHIRQRWYCPDPPRHLADDPDAEIAWRGRVIADYADRALLALATGQPLDDVPLVVDPEPSMPEDPAATKRIKEMCDDVSAAKAIPAADQDGEPPTVSTYRAALARPCPFCSAAPDEPCTHRRPAPRTPPDPSRFAAVDACTGCDPTGMRLDDPALVCAHDAAAGRVAS